MAFFKISTSEDQIKDRGESNFIRNSGMYDVIIKHVLYNKSPNGSESIDLVIDYNGQEQVLWGAIRLTNNDGSPNISAPLFNKLCIVCGGEEGNEISDPVPVTLNIAKGGEPKDCMELQDLADNPVTMRIQMSYHIYAGEIREQKIIRNLFRSTDHATAQELVNKTNYGAQYNEELKIADKVEYKDDLTETEVQNWRKERASNRQQQDTQKTPSGTFKRHSFGRTA